MKISIVFALVCFTFFTTACVNSTETKAGDTTVIENTTPTEKAEKEESREPVSGDVKPLPQVQDYSGLMTEYHEILCRTAKRKLEQKPVNIDDSLRLTEVKMELDKIGKNLSGEEKTKFNFALAHAMNMQSCL